MTTEEWVFKVVNNFYDKAKTDVLIGYHFWRIKDFDKHIPRIAAFWEIQLLGSTLREVEIPFDVINAHIPLGIKKGELGRWMVLFKKTLEENAHEYPELKVVWEGKLRFFEGVFSRFFGL